MDNLKVVETLKQKISIADKILIIASSPVDYDSMGTALVIKWYILKKFLKESNIYFFGNSTPDNKNFPGFTDNINQSHPDKVDFKKFDLIITLDGNSPRQFFTSNFKFYIEDLDFSKIYNIDHHSSGPFVEYIPNNIIRVEDSSTGKVFYDLFIKEDLNLTLDKEVATWLYLGLIGDTGVFNWGVYPDTFKFAQTLLDCGVDHLKSIDFTISKSAMEFTAWAINATKYIEEAKSTFLVLDKQTKEYLSLNFGKEWENDYFIKYYMSTFTTKVQGYPYAFVLKESKDENNIRIVWRAHPASPISILELLKSLSYVANGHRNAGGGMIQKEIATIIREITYKIKDFTN